MLALNARHFPFSTRRSITWRGIVKIIFLSFSKCAGVAIRNAITRNNPHLRRLPAWGRSQTCRYPIAELNRYDFFAGHLDWSDLDCLEGERFVFTVLRPPLERTISQYCHWRDQYRRWREQAAKAISRGDLPADRQPMEHLVHTLSPAEFFEKLLSKDWKNARDWFDNLYTYFFFYRGYYGRRWARLNGLSTSDVLELALANMAHIDYVATFANLDQDMREVERLTGIRFAHDLRVENRSTFGSGSDRRDLVQQWDPSGHLEKTLHAFTVYDSIIYDLASTKRIGRARHAAQVQSGPISGIATS
jgi:hypothetical protein